MQLLLWPAICSCAAPFAKANARIALGSARFAVSCSLVLARRLRASTSQSLGFSLGLSHGNLDLEAT